MIFCVRIRIKFHAGREDFIMYSFQNDYSEGAHPNILRALETINYHQNHSYGLDAHSDAARDLIQEALEDYLSLIHI